MPDIIHLLPDNVANQIAAGEVVQRPASVVKELLENAIDAGATEIKLLIKEAGKTLIQVIDNGRGMSPSDARLSFERHATSKITSAEDLFGLKTKGFRGEALASIAAVAHVELKTRTEGEELGTHLKIAGNEINYQEFIATPIGASLSVKNLFFNIPARRNFLKSNSVELRHIIDEFHRVSLTHPDISFIYYNNDHESLKLELSNLRQRIVAVFGKKINEKLVPIQEQTDIISISGFVSKPEFAKKKRGEQFFFVNNRYIRNGYLHHAVMNAFDQLLSPGYFPSYFLYLEVPPNSIDINIHPTKTEIKFDNEQALYAILRSTVKHSLGQYNVSPVLDFNKDANLDIPYFYKDISTATTPKITVDPKFNPFKESGSSPTYNQHGKASWETLYNQSESLDSSINQIEVEAEVVTQTLFDEDHYGVQAKTFQVRKKYIVSVIKSGLILINQNLAHQRILYEELLTKMTLDNSISQHLLFPLTLSFSQPEITLCIEIQEELESLGFQFEAIKDETIILNGIPATMKQGDLQQMFEALFDSIKNQVPDTNFSQLDTMVKSIAKSFAIKNGTKLSTVEQEDIVEGLFSCKEPSFSPAGKKTFITTSFDEIQLKFDR